MRINTKLWLSHLQTQSIDRGEFTSINAQKDQPRSEGEGEDRVFEEGGADLKGADADLGEAVSAVKSQGAVVFRVDAEQEAGGLLLSG